jgi:hypothetical protein
MNTPNKRGRGRPKKVRVEGGLPESEIIAMAEAAKGKDSQTSYDSEKFYVTVVDEFNPSKMEAVVSVMEDVALAKKHIEKLKKKPEYSPYDNPRFKFKNGLDKK